MLKDQIKQLEDAGQLLQNNINEATSKWNDLVGQNKELEGAIQHLQNQLNEATLVEGEIKNKNKHLEETINTLQNDIRLLVSEQDRLSQENDFFKNQIELLKNQHLEAQGRAEREFADKLETFRQSKDQELGQALRRAQEDTESIIEEKEKEIRHLEGEIQKLLQEVNQREKDLTNAGTRMDELQRSFAAERSQILDRLENEKADEIVNLVTFLGKNSQTILFRKK